MPCVKPKKYNYRNMNISFGIIFVRRHILPVRNPKDRLLVSKAYFIIDQQFYAKLLEEIVIKQFCSPREDPKTEMAAISEETFSQTVSQLLSICLTIMFYLQLSFVPEFPSLN